MDSPEKSDFRMVQSAGESSPPSPNDRDSVVQQVRGATRQDDYDMNRLGRTQQLDRKFGGFSILGLTVMTMIPWIAMLTSLDFVYINGGRAGAIYDYIAGWIGETLVVASLAEMASMAPTSAGQYHWVSEFAPSSIQKPLSYLAGWLAALTWQTYVATPAFQAAEITLVLAQVQNANYTPTAWQETLLTLAFALLVFLFNVYGARALPATEGFALLMLVIGFLAALIPLWVLAPKVPAHEAFGQFANYGGWSSIGAACFIGQIAAVGAMTGCDAAAHMSEEVKDASKTVPRMMMWTVMGSGVMGFLVTITLSLVIQDLQMQVVDSTAAYPFIDIFSTSVGSTKGAVGMTVLTIPLSLLCSVSSMATASRQAWAFARDQGLPFSPWFTKLTIANGTPLPVNAMIASLGITVIIALLNLGGDEVFDSVYGLGSSAASMTYIIGIGSVLWRRLLGSPLPPARWSLGYFGVPINSIALLFLMQYVVAAYFPLFNHPTVETMNWGIVLFGGCAFLSMCYYIIAARKSYHGPVVHLRQS